MPGITVGIALGGPVLPAAAATGPTIDTAGSLDVSTFKIGTEHTITEGTASATGGGTVTYEYRWLVGGVSDATTAAYTPQAADDEQSIAAQWRAVESGGTNDGATAWQTVGSGTITAPIAILSSPTAAQDGADLDWGVTSDSTFGTIYAAYRLASDAQLSASEIINGTGDAIGTDTDATPTADANNAGTFTAPADETYDVDMVQVNSGGNSNVVSSAAVTIDTVDPIINTFTVAQTGSTIEFTIDVATGEDSYFAYIVGVTAGETAPSVAQTIAGQNNAGGNAEFWVDGYEFATDLTDQAITMDRETAGINGNIDWYLVVQDSAGNNSTQASDLGVAIDTTSAISGEILTEAGAAMLAEDGSVMLTEAFTGTEMSAESGDDMLTEDDRLMLTEA